MPKQEQSIQLTGLSKERIMAVSYSTFKNLGWKIQNANREKLLGLSPRDWKTYGQLITVKADENLLTLSSEMIHGEAFDLRGRNKKNIQAFLAAFEAARQTIREGEIEENKMALSILDENTGKQIAEEKRLAEETESVMNLSGSNLYATYSIIGINLLVFILMVLNGAGIMEVNAMVHIRWGSNFTPLTLSGDGWRLLTNIFLHFGIIHLLMNMFCLYTIGIYLEPMLGKIKYITAYLCTGVLASIVSLWWHNDGVNSAGASGAIFGMYGLFLALLSTNLIPRQVRQPLLQSIGIFVVYNLVYGMKSGVDNSAHVGGLLSGFILGCLYAFGIKKEKQEVKQNWILPLVIGATVAGSFFYLDNHKVSKDKRLAELAQLKDAGFKDNERFNSQLVKFDNLHKEIQTMLSDTTLTNEKLKGIIQNEIIPDWKKEREIVNETKDYDISSQMQEKRLKLWNYIDLRGKEADLMLQIINASGLKDAELIPELNELRKQYTDLFGTIATM